MRQVLAFAAEALLQIGFRDEARVVNIEVMESESHISFRDSSPAVDSHSQELRVVDLTIMIEIYAFEDLIDFALRHVKLIERSSDFTELQRARVVSIKSPESVAQFSEVKGARVHLVNQESKSFNLKAFRLTEVLNATQDLEFVGVKECRVMASVVLLNVV